MINVCHLKLPKMAHFQRLAKFFGKIQPFFFKLTYRISSLFSEKASKNRFFGLDKLQNHSSEGKKKGEKERARRKKGEKGEEEKKTVVALLVFITAALAKKK